VKSGPRTRHDVLLRKLLRFDPSFFDFVADDASVKNSTKSAIKSTSGSIRSLIHSINDKYSAKFGEDYFKATNKTAKAQTTIEVQVTDIDEYKALIDSCYFTFWEGAKSRLPEPKPKSFVDINDLRTAEQHDVDHGKKAEIKKKRLRLGKAFQKYAGKGTPNSIDPFRFALMQLNLLAAVEQDLHTIHKTLS
jgi:hypothetical protein